jgi:hypothetical protein
VPIETRRHRVDAEASWLAGLGGVIVGVLNTAPIARALPPPGIGALNIFVASFAIGVGGTGWQIQGESFPNAVRGQAAAIAADVDWAANFALIEVFPTWQSGIGLGWIMVCFAAISVIAIGFIYGFLPETKNRSVEEITELVRAPGRRGPACWNQCPQRLVMQPPPNLLPAQVSGRFVVQAEWVDDSGWSGSARLYHSISRRACGRWFAGRPQCS